MRTPPRSPSSSGNSPLLLHAKKPTSITRLLMNHSLAIFLGLALLWGCWLFHLPMPDHSIHGPADLIPDNNNNNNNNSNNSNNKQRNNLAAGKGTFLQAFDDVLKRAKKNRDHCQAVVPDAQNQPEPTQDVIEIANMTTARLQGFGIVKALEEWNQQPTLPTHIANGATNTQCVVPPENECQEQQFTVIFMAYNPDRLTKLMKQIGVMLSPPYNTIVHEIVLVWNGPRHVDESMEGKALIELTHQEYKGQLRIVYPLHQGLPNDLMNRYHPDIVQVQTKGILYYDDDGPFYSYEAILGGFELWKRNSNAQIGAMARVIDLDPRQQTEKNTILGDNKLNDREFISHCANDDVEYNFRFFANFQANMVLPSGSFLHSNYLCFLWHPVFETIRDYVRAHPVHPDDITVSMMVSQLAGRAPKVYSRRINLETKTDQLKETKRLKSIGQWPPPNPNTRIGRRRLMFGIDWDKGHNMNDDKEKWAQLRSGAVNSLVRYFGSINSGSIGWCVGTEYHQRNKQGEDYCNPDMARFGKLPWLNIDHTSKETCP